jgi:hypothetical protein
LLEKTIKGLNNEKENLEGEKDKLEEELAE